MAPQQTSMNDAVTCALGVCAGGEEDAVVADESVMGASEIVIESLGLPASSKTIKAGQLVHLSCLDDLGSLVTIGWGQFTKSQVGLC